MNRWAKAAFAIGVALRLALALANTDANDNHLAAVEIIERENRLPHRTEAFEAYHPPLYHIAAALLWKAAPTDSPHVRVRLAQLLNAAAGVWTLLVFWRLLQRSGVGERAASLTFALAALNPKLIAIQSQATNDAFVILLGALALEAAHDYFRTPAPRALWRMTAFAALAPLAKANGFVIVLAIAGAFAYVWLRTKKVSLRPFAVFVLLSVGAPFALGPYGQRWVQEGSPFVANIPPSPPADWVRETVYMRPGTTSIIHALGTFRLVGLLERPQITNGESDYPRHRTSLWTQVYARWHFAHYDNWPRTWQTSAPALLWLGRLILLLALPVTALGLFGLLRRSRSALPEEAALLLAAWGSLAFLAWFALRYRDFASMKAIYAFPALAGFVLALARGLDAADGTAKRCWTALVLALATLYGIDAAWLTGHLLARKLPMLLGAGL